MKKEIGMLTAGILVGAMIASPAAGAVSDLFTAQWVSYPVYVDGRSVDLDAYAIDGRTYVQLRELGREVGFNVYWKDNAAQVQSGVPYTGEAPPATDYAAQANPAIFQGQYTREL